MTTPTKRQRLYLQAMAAGDHAYEPPPDERHHCRIGAFRLYLNTLVAFRARRWIEIDHITPWGETFWRITDAGRKAAQ